LENDRKQILNEREILANRRYEMGNKWQGLEVDSFKRLILLQIQDMRALRNRKQRLIDQREQLLSFINGGGTALGRTKFRAALSQFEQSSQTVSLLQYSIPALGARNFSADAGSVLATTLNANSTLASPPFLLAGRSSGDRVAIERGRVEVYWNTVVAKLRNDTNLFSDDYQRLETSLNAWREAADAALAEGTMSDRIAAKNYLQQVDGLFAKLKSPSQTDNLRRHVKGHYFPGGTVADLVHFVLDQGISVRYGSSAQLILRDLGSELIRDLDSQQPEKIRPFCPAKTFYACA